MAICVLTGCGTGEGTPSFTARTLFSQTVTVPSLSTRSCPATLASESFQTDPSAGHP